MSDPRLNRTRIAQIVQELGGIELEVLAEVAARLLMGQGQYGKFQEGDKRDWAEEALQEAADLLVYLARARRPP